MNDTTQAYLTNLTGAVKQVAHGPCERDYSGSGIYAGLWRDAWPYLHAAAASVWQDPKTPWSALRTALKYRWGQLYNAKLAARYGHDKGGGASRDMCPLCGMPDSGTHIMGECQHPTMHALYVKRHDEAVGIINKAITKGRYGNCFKLMDAGKRGALPGDVAGKGSDLAGHLLPGGGPTSKPDLVYVPSLTAAQLSEAMEANAKDWRSSHEVVLIEVGYCSDLNMPGKAADKHAQHQDLATTLAVAGWKVRYRADCECVSLGHGGSVMRNVERALTDMGVPTTAAQGCIRKLARHAVHMGHQIVTARRCLERAQPG